MNNIQNTDIEAGPISPFSMLILGFAVGIIGGIGAVIFRMMISFFHNLLFYGEFDLFYDANVHALPSLWGIGIIFVPVLGALGVAWLVQTFAPEAKGHGVPEVMDSIYYNKGRIRPLVALFKSIASALSIGSGGSVGREGPIIQIGAAFGSTLGQWVKMPVRQRVTLIAAGAGAGIAATFNAPIGGIAFAVELLLVSINASTMAVVAISTITAAYIGRFFLGLSPAFDIPELTVPTWHLASIAELLLFIPFGILIGFASTLFIQSIYWFEDRFEHLPMNYYFQHMLGMFMLGLMMYAFMSLTGHYYVQGVGYATIVDVLKGTLLNPWFLLLLCAAKLLATSLTLGSGASGGVFSPALFIGATLGGAFGGIVQVVFPHMGLSVSMFAVAGMAGMVGGTTGAVLTAITMLFEMTRDYNAILPIVLTVTLAYLTRMTLTNESIYTLKLLRRGHAVHEGLQAAMSSAQLARHIMNQDFHIITQSRLHQHPEIARDPEVAYKPLIVENAGDVLGLLLGGINSILEDGAIDTHFIFITPETGLLSILRQMRRSNVNIAFVVPNLRALHVDNVVGVITPREITDVTGRFAELMNETV